MTSNRSITKKFITKKNVAHSMFLVIALSLGFSGCNTGAVGIFYSIEKLESTTEENRSLEPNAPIHSLTELDGNYYITTPALRMRKAAENTPGSPGYNWKLVPKPDGYSSTGKVASDGADLYVHFIGDSKDGMKSGLFSVPKASISYDAGLVDWEEVSTGSGEVATFFIAENDNVFAVIKELATYSIYDVTGGKAITDDNDITDQMKFQPVIDIAHITDGPTQYMAISDKMVYIIDDATSTIQPVAQVKDVKTAPFDSKDKTYGFSGLIQVKDDKLYLTTKNGYIFEYNAGVWSQYGDDKFSRTFAAKKEATAFLDMHDATGFTAPFDKIYAGSKNHGYVTIDGTGKVGYVDITTRNTNFHSSENTFVKNVYYDDTTATIFALTPKNSLWQGKFTESKLRWTKETKKK